MFVTTFNHIYMKSNSEITEKEFTERLTRSEAAEFLGVSYVTLTQWIKKGLVKERGIGKKKYHLKSDLLRAVGSC